MQRILPLLFVACLLIPCARVSAAEPASDAGFVLKTAPFKINDYVAIRLQKSTGKSYYVKGGNWQPIRDAEAQPVGHYDVLIASSGHPDQSNWQGFRINLDTGKSWRLVTGKWELMQTLTDE